MSISLEDAEDGDGVCRRPFLLTAPHPRVSQMSPSLFYRAAHIGNCLTPTRTAHDNAEYEEEEEYYEEEEEEERGGSASLWSRSGGVLSSVTSVSAEMAAAMKEELGGVRSVERGGAGRGRGNREIPMPAGNFITAHLTLDVHDPYMLQPPSP